MTWSAISEFSKEFSRSYLEGLQDTSPLTQHTLAPPPPAWMKVHDNYRLALQPYPPTEDTRQPAPQARERPAIFPATTGMWDSLQSHFL